jgi:uncharacterized repeat protein (TIGR01451 family)
MLRAAKLLVRVIALSLVPAFAQVSAPVATVSATPQVHKGYGQLPLVFEPNMGQSDPQVKFLARGSGYGLFLTAKEAVLNLRAGRPGATGVLRMSLAGANANALVSGSDLLPGKSNYLTGNDPARWHQGVAQFARVRYQGIYPGIDLVYYGKQGQLEYDFEVSPGANPKQVALQFAGADQLQLDHDGNLLLAVNGRPVRFEAPQVYQNIDGKKKPVRGNFALYSDQKVGFEIGEYDRTRALIIDPVVTYSTYLGGIGAEAFPSIAVDASFNAYIAGTTTSADFPIVQAPTSFQSCFNDPTQPQPVSPNPCPAVSSSSDVFIAKIDPSGTTLVFSTYLGGSGDDSSAGIAVDSAFNVVVAGTTGSPNFPVLNAFQGTQGPSASNHVFVSELNSNGQNLVYSTYLEGTGIDTATGVALDTKNKIYVTGTTTSVSTTASDHFPTTMGSFQPNAAPGASTQFFLSKIDPATSAAASLPYSTFFGGSNPTNGVTVGGGIAVDKSNNVYITGGTNFLHTGGNPATDFPILNAFQSCLDVAGSPCPANVTATDAFVAKFAPSTSQPALMTLVYSTYIGGGGNDVANGIAVDSGGLAYVVGTTNSADIGIPNLATTVPFQCGLNMPANPATPIPNPCPGTGTATDAFLAKLTNFTTGTTTVPTVALSYFTYVGGTADETGLAVAVDSVQSARVTGSTASGDFHITAAPATPTQPTFGGGGTDAFVTRIDTTATTATATSHFSTYLGGSGPDRGTGIAVDNSGAVYITGDTSSTDFPRANAFQNALDGSSDAFVTKLGGVPAFTMTVAASPNPSGVGNSVTFTYTIKNSGDLASNIVYVNALPASGASFVSASASGGSCGSPSGTPATVTCSLGTLNTNATSTVTVVLTPTAGTSLGNSANVVSPGTATASTNVAVSDFSLAVTPPIQTVVAGSAVTYTAQVTPNGNFPNSVSLTCSSLPTGTSCSVTNGAITDLKNGSPQTRAIVVNTTARVTTTTGLQTPRAYYAMWLPVSGLAFLSLGVGGITLSRRRRVVLGMLIGAFVTFMLILPGCGSSSKTTTTTTGTPAGTVSFNITATSGSATRSQALTLNVQ